MNIKTAQKLRPGAKLLYHPNGGQQRLQNIVIVYFVSLLSRAGWDGDGRKIIVEITRQEPDSFGQFMRGSIERVEASGLAVYTDALWNMIQIARENQMMALEAFWESCKIENHALPKLKVAHDNKPKKRIPLKVEGTPRYDLFLVKGGAYDQVTGEQTVEQAESRQESGQPVPASGYDDDDIPF